MRRVWRLFSLFGRARNREYWATTVPANAFFASFFTFAIRSGSTVSEGVAAAVGLTVLVVMPPLLWINLAVGVRRLHDRGKTGWWTMLFYGWPFAMTTIGPLVKDQPVGAVVYLSALGAMLWGFVSLGILPGTEGINRYAGKSEAAKTAEVFS